MNYRCPNKSCSSHSLKHQIIKDGTFFRPSDSRHIQRFKCKCCGTRFSQATFSPAYRQNKRRINFTLLKLLASNSSMASAARLLHVNPKTIARKLIFLGDLCRSKNCTYLQKLVQLEGKFTHIQIDDLLTIEHTKCKPLTVTMVVSNNTRKILGFRVKSSPATGHLAKIARAKYGIRPDKHREGIIETLQQIKPLVNSSMQIDSDQHLLYPAPIKKFFPDSTPNKHKGDKPKSYGQGELKQVPWDPLFYINHTFAMLRAGISRLIRRSWNTTKKVERLIDAINIYVYYHNTVLTEG